MLDRAGMVALRLGLRALRREHFDLVLSSDRSGIGAVQLRRFLAHRRIRLLGALYSAAAGPHEVLVVADVLLPGEFRRRLGGGDIGLLLIDDQFLQHDLRVEVANGGFGGRDIGRRLMERGSEIPIVDAGAGALACSARQLFTNRWMLSCASSYPRPRSSSKSRIVERRSRRGNLSSASRIEVSAPTVPICAAAGPRVVDELGRSGAKNLTNRVARDPELARDPLDPLAVLKMLETDPQSYPRPSSPDPSAKPEGSSKTVDGGRIQSETHPSEEQHSTRSHTYDRKITIFERGMGPIPDAPVFRQACQGSGLEPELGSDRSHLGNAG